MLLKSLAFSGAGPFEDVEFDFDPKVNVFTGLNDSGKTTILSVLGEILAYPYTMPDNMVWSEESKWRLEYTAIDGKQRSAATKFFVQHPNLGAILQEIGYTCYVPAMRLSTGSRPAGPTTVKRNDHVGSHVELQKRVNLLMTRNQYITDEDLMQKIIDLDYRGYLSKRGRIHDVIKHIFSVVAEIINSLIFSFTGIEEDESSNLYLGVRYKDHSVIATDTLGHGIQSLIQIVGRFLLGYGEYYDFPKELEDRPATLIVDDIDAHLQPPWQKGLIKALTRNFPNMQLFCSVNSPLTIAGLEPGQVHYLYFNDNRKYGPRNTAAIQDRHIVNVPQDSVKPIMESRGVTLTPEHHSEDSYHIMVADDDPIMALQFNA